MSSAVIDQGIPAAVVHEGFGRYFVVDAWRNAIGAPPEPLDRETAERVATRIGVPLVSARERVVREGKYVGAHRRVSAKKAGSVVTAATGALAKARSDLRKTEAQLVRCEADRETLQLHMVDLTNLLAKAHEDNAALREALAEARVYAEGMRVVAHPIGPAFPWEKR